MTWLRISDGFASNKKIAQFSDREFRVWLRLLCYCAKEQDPSVDAIVTREVPGVTKAFIRRCHTLELLDAIGDDHEVHDWSHYLPKDGTNADRQARWRARRNASRNGQVTAPVTPKVTA